jgi:hypothetical protein
MIISASYRTDIPAFYGPWFLRRLRDGRCRVVNPWGGKAYAVALTPDAVDGFVFWTRNLRPFAPHLARVRRRAPFVVQYTVTNYPRILDAGGPTARQALDDIRSAARDYGQSVVVWRYDPILISSLTPAEWHLRNFRTLASQLAGAVDEAVVSFTHFYRKTQRKLTLAAGDHGFHFQDPAPIEKQRLVAELATISAEFGILLTVCSQPEYAAGDAGAARCIDADRLSRVADRYVSAPVKGNRPGCGCHESRDIGAYDTCPHGCVYCYAVRSRDLAKARHAEHDPAKSSLGRHMVGGHCA